MGGRVRVAAEASPVAIAAASSQSRSLRGNPAVQLGLAALTIGVLFGALLVAPMPLWATVPPRPPLPGAPAPEPVGWIGLLVPAVFLLALCLPFRPYAQAQKLVAERRIAPGLILLFTGLLALVAVLMFPGYGSDVFDYLGFERMWVVYGDNPLSALPINHPGDWSAALVWYPGRTPAYGPLWALLTWPIAQQAGNSPMAAVLGYKVLSIVAYAVCCWLVWSCVPRTDRARALVTFAWSPLVLFEVLGKVHNDVLPAVFVLLGIWLAGRERARVLSLAAIAAGTLVKLTAVAAAPPLALGLGRRGTWRLLPGAVALAVVLVGVLYLPFWQGPQTLAPIWNQTSQVVWSPASVLIVLSDAFGDGGHATALVVRGALGLAWLGCCLAALRRSRDDDDNDVAATSGWLLLATLLLLTSAVYSHYLVPAIALAAVSRDRLLRTAVFWLSLGGLAAYAVELLSLTFGAEWIGSDGYRLLGSLVLLVPAAAAVLLAQRRRLRATP